MALAGCASFSSSRDFDNYILDLRLEGKPINEATARLVKLKFACEPPRGNKVSCSHRRILWYAEEIQSVDLTYEPVSGLVTNVHSNWGTYAS